MTSPVLPPDTDLTATDDGYELRFHPDPLVDARVREALADLDALDDSKRFAVTAAINTTGAELVSMVKIAKGWSFAGVVNSDWKGHVKGEAMVRFSV